MRRLIFSKGVLHSRSERGASAKAAALSLQTLTCTGSRPRIRQEKWPAAAKENRKSSEKRKNIGLAGYGESRNVNGVTYTQHG